MRARGSVTSVSDLSKPYITVYLKVSMSQKINHAIPRLESAFKLLDGVTPLVFPKAIVVSDQKQYHVDFQEETCECPDYQFRNVKCKHIWACQIKLKIQSGEMKIA